MQRDHALKKMNFDLLTPYPGSRGVEVGGSAGIIFATMMVHS